MTSPQVMSELMLRSFSGLNLSPNPLYMRHILSDKIGFIVPGGNSVCMCSAEQNVMHSVVNTIHSSALG